MEQRRPATEKELAVTDWAWRAMLLFADLDPTPLEREGDSLVGIIEDGDGILHECVIPVTCPDAYNYIPWAQRIMNNFFDTSVRKHQIPAHDTGDEQC